MTASVRLAIGVIVLLPMIVSCAAGSGSNPQAVVVSPSSSAGLTTTATIAAGQVPVLELTETFTSANMRFSVTYPAGWTATPATEPWLPGASNFWDDPVGDRIEGDDAGFRGTSQPLEPGQTATAWLDEYLRSARPFSCGDQEQVPVGDQTGTMDLNGCTGKGRLGGRVWDVALVAGDRGYNFTMEGEVDRQLLLAMLASVKFLPGP